MATTVGLPHPGHVTIPPGHVTITPGHVTIPPDHVTSVEGQLHEACQVKRIRVSEFFKDYDPLRSGYITCEQFRRCLDQYLSVKLSDDDFSILCKKYITSQDGQVNYRVFTAQLENAFDPDILDGKPQEQILAFQSSDFGLSIKAMQPVLTIPVLFHAVVGNQMLSGSQQLTDNILQRCQEYYEYHGISVKSSYADFDWHHRGYITHTQFERNFPGPADLSTTELTALVQRYLDPNTGLCNYLHFHHDIETLTSFKNATTQPRPLNTITHNSTVTCGVEEILERVKDAVYNNGIRTPEFFIDHDKLRSGLITVNQFVCGLSICCGSAIRLTRDEVQRLVDYYSTGDGRIRYKEFCHLMENAYNVPDLERRPTVDVYRPLRGHLTKPLHTLTRAYDEERVVALVARLSSVVANRRLLLYPYFKDFDKGNGYSRSVTKSHFERVINFAALGISQEEIKLLMSKFGSSNGTDVNYAAFVQAIDPDFIGQTKQSLPTTTETSNQMIAIEEQIVDVDELVARIREHVVTNRIRVSEHFEDFDHLRSGSITIPRFRQGLSSLGLPYLTDGQVKALSSHYAHSKHRDGVDWKTFTSEVDPVLSKFEQTPLALCRAGATVVSSTPDKELLDNVMGRLRERASQRRVLAKPCFQDFDRNHIGYVTRNQFRQCLSYLDLPANEAELSVMEARYCHNKGFHYLTFLEHLSPSQPLVDKYTARMSHMLSTKVNGTHERTGSCNIEDILEAIKIQVCKRRICVLEFMKDYDKLRSGRILKTAFRRALDLCGFELAQSELAVLEQRYESGKDGLCVDYTRFSDDIESIFTTKGLEKKPTAQVTQFSVPVELKQLSPSEEQVLHEALCRLAQRVRVRRIQLMPLFGDYDKVHNGSVTQSQFSRVLKDLELESLVNAAEMRLLYRKFDVKVGGWSNVQYIDFCAVCDSYPH